MNCLCIHALDGYETYKIDENTVGVRPIWIKCSDRLPEKSQHVIASDGDDVGEYIFFGDYFETDEGYGINATHWMPLPKPPKK